MATILNGSMNGLSLQSASGAKPIELSFPLPDAPTTHVNLHLTDNQNSLLVFLTTSTTESASGTAPLGSLIYAIPNTSNPRALPLTTPLVPHASTQDFATRVATALARKVSKPVYVGSSLSFSNAALGGVVEEEMRGLSRCIDVIVRCVDGKISHSVV
ncbi:hypothetical protein EJ05DRAFT_501555 [Pseudovirgaria hyperparasitica]|uniref:Proteasome assembly chaperone 3 n=1 Tax=Pseudovirgaria hyperparasitica TaxID=470096 RepID=A0A6A6W2C7_9PEZI|nr:uncharacterized protein EJ05DRAFT_501555 [Pseudovirgaria hyperparasitica]KAF2757012.1 hypothetical protein EJ05DRAFT_501555 [Pseudovirgaria hyperparasitica]